MKTSFILAILALQAAASAVYSQTLAWFKRFPERISSIQSITRYEGVYYVAGDGLSMTSDFTNWTRLPLPIDREVNRLAVGNGRYVAVGGGSIASSRDLTNWRVELMTNAVSDVAFGAGRFVVTSEGALLSSSDGDEWLRHPTKTPLPRLVFSIIFAQDKFVAVGGDNAYADIFTSTNGLDWQSEVGPDERNNRGVFGRLTKVAYANGVFLAPNSAGVLMRSTNAQDWVGLRDLEVPLTPEGGADRFLAVAPAPENRSAIYSSFDGLQWTQVTTLPNMISDLSYSEGKWIAFSPFRSENLFQSADGSTWSAVALPPVPWLGSHSGWALCDGPAGLVVVGPVGSVARSADGVQWESQTLGPFHDLYGIAYGHAGYVAVGYAGKALVLRSTEGVSWTRENNDGPSALGEIAYGNGTYVAAGREGGFWISRDGRNWMATGQQFRGLIAALGFVVSEFVAFSPSQMLRSADGIRWNSVPHDLGRVEDLTFADGHYVIVSDGRIATSTNLSSFTVYLNWQLGPLFAIAAGNGTWLALGDTRSAVSTDRGKTWVLGGPAGWDVIFARDTFITAAFRQSEVVPSINVNPFYTFNRTTGDLFIPGGSTNDFLLRSADLEMWSGANDLLVNERGTIGIRVQTRAAPQMFFQRRAPSGVRLEH